MILSSFEPVLGIGKLKRPSVSVVPDSRLCPVSLSKTETVAFWAAPFIWVSLEYLRSNLSFVALPWGLLAHSQYQHPLVIQVASVAGVYGVSFLVVAVNAALAALIYLLMKQLMF